MNRTGHVGLTLLAFAPVAYILVGEGHLALAVLSWGGIQAVEPLPDQDFHLPWLTHRGVSHSLVAALVVGSVLGVSGWFLGHHLFALLPGVLSEGTDSFVRLVGLFPDPVGPTFVDLVRSITPTEITDRARQPFEQSVDQWVFALFGFAIGVYGVCVHLLGDSITVRGIRPLLPVSQRRVSLSPLRADNPTANTALFGLGVLAILVVLGASVPSVGLGPSAPADLSPVGVGAAQQPTQTANSTLAAVELNSSNTTTATTVVVSEARLPNGGFIAIHTGGFAEGGLLVGSAVTGSRYLPSGTHRNVTIPVERGVPGTSTTVSRLNLTRANLSAVVYRDTNNNQQFDFIASRGRIDTPYERPGGKPLADTESVVFETNVQRAHQRSRVTPATLRVPDQHLQRTNDTRTVVAATVTLPRGGFVAVHDTRYLPPTRNPLDSVLGHSRYLSPGTHRNVTIRLPNGSLTTTQTLVAVPYLDTNGNRRYDYVRSGGERDYASIARRNGTNVVVTETASVRVRSSPRTTLAATSSRTTSATDPAPSTASETPALISTTSHAPTTPQTMVNGPNETTTGISPDEQRGFVGRNPLLALLTGAGALAVVLAAIGRTHRRL